MVFNNRGGALLLIFYHPNLQQSSHAFNMERRLDNLADTNTPSVGQSLAFIRDYSSKDRCLVEHVFVRSKNNRMENAFYLRNGYDLREVKTRLRCLTLKSILMDILFAGRA